MGQSIRTCFSKYAIFHGRAGRSEYWWFFLLYICLNHGATLFDEFIYKIPGEPILVGGGVLSISSLIVVCGMLLPLLAVGARRLHDTGRSGWWQVLWLTFIGGLLVSYWMAKDGEEDDNEFGPSPKLRT